MKKEKVEEQDDKKQSKLFIEKAKEIGANKSTSASDELMGTLAKMKPEPRPPPKAGTLNGPTRWTSRSISMRTTAGPTRSAAVVTAYE